MSALTLNRSQRHELRRLKAEFYSESEHAEIRHDVDFCFAFTPVDPTVEDPEFFYVACSWLSPKASTRDYNRLTGEFYALRRLQCGEATVMHRRMIDHL